MKRTVSEITANRARCETILRQAELELKRLTARYPDIDRKHLRVQKYRKGYQYYEVEAAFQRKNHKKSSNGTYIAQTKLKKARIIAQRDYLVSVCRTAKDWLLYYDRLLTQKIPPELSELHLKNPGRHQLISPVMLSDQEFLDQWTATPYEGKAFAEDAIFQRTERGEKVRSKSEKMIADLLFKLRIPYKYECPLELSLSEQSPVSRIIYPDFTLLDIKHRQEIYLEHFGLLEKDDYKKGTVWKLNAYAANGFFPGDRLLFFWEGENIPLNLSHLTAMLKNAGLLQQ